MLRRYARSISWSEEIRESNDVGWVQRASRGDARRLVPCQAPLRRVAQRAVEADSLNTNPFLRETDRQLLSFLPRDQRGVAAGTGKVLRAEHSRQHHGDPVG